MVGGAKVLIHTASRYDECELFFLPLAKASLGFEWVCRGEPHHHHHVVRCLHSKLPVLPAGQVRFFVGVVREVFWVASFFHQLFVVSELSVRFFGL